MKLFTSLFLAALATHLASTLVYVAYLVVFEGAHVEEIADP